MPELPAYRVLLVEDEPCIRDLLSSRLKEAGFEAQESQDGIAGLLKRRDMFPNGSADSE